MYIDLSAYDAYPLMVRVYEHLLKTSPIYGRMLKGLINIKGGEFWENGELRCKEILYLCDGDLNKFLDSVSAWVRFSIEYQRRQQNFLKNRRYVSTDYNSILHELYQDNSKMNNYYLPALMFSYVLSVNYIGFLSFFKNEFLPQVKGVTAVCDVGCGAGVYLAQMLLTETDAVGIGLDISEASLEMSHRLLKFHNISVARFRLLKGDLRGRLPISNHTQDAVVCCEVLEHLENPLQALIELRRLLQPSGVLCISTAIRMESIDHIYLFSDLEEVRQMLRESGFQVISDDCIPLTTDIISDDLQRSRLINDPNVPLGYIAIAS